MAFDTPSFRGRRSGALPSGAESSVFSEAILIEDETVAGIVLHLVFPAGEASNPFDEGLAHYVEDLAWLGVFGKKDDDDDHHSNAQVNGFTTLYRLDTNRDDLPDSLRKLISVSAPLSVESDFALQERNILLREYDLRVRERPLYPVYREMDRSLFGTGMLARSVIGEPSMIARYSLEDARSLHRRSHLLSSATRCWLMAM
ncbi:MAG: insulinase family protein [Ectothiorhodospiraceae bacterium AqS1]|nr:insulinase family protein [Ectothiorhodospiraceae bacterium AqS1]